jgi:hypothetical protein
MIHSSKPGRKGLDPEARFWPKVDRQTEDACWNWTAAVFRGGYGLFRKDGRNHLAHRFAYELAKGSIPEGLHLDHLCRNRACVNPAHLEPVTNRVNALRGESFSAVNAAKAHCLNGHAFDEANTYTYPNGHRECRACNAARQRAYRARKAGKTA